jgi:hypothetical protein
VGLLLFASGVPEALLLYCVAILIMEIFCLLAATVEGTFKSLDAGFRYIPAWLTVSDYKEMYKRMQEIWVSQAPIYSNLF